MRKKTLELLAPAGSFESLQAAIQAGADSVYFGVEQLNMRAKSVNSFTIDDLGRISKICKAANIKSYLTLNTVMYDHDRQLIKTILEKVKKTGIDAVIAADFAVIELCNQIGIPLHISTQANISNIEAVNFFAKFSDVVVLARELTLKQVKQITKEIERRKITGVSGKPVKVEIFVHGALCMAISGKCHLSLHEQNSSANRGACTQNCRRSYTVIDNDSNNELLIENEYIMSAKDLCTIGILDEVIDAGVEVLKIEGRGKSPEYVYTVTKCYKEAMESIAQGTFTKQKVDEWMNELAKVYNRGFWEGYYLGRKLGEWSNAPGSIATERKVYVGRSSRYYPKLQVSEFLVETGSLKKGDTVMVIGEKLGVLKATLQEMKVNGEDIDEAKKGDKITFPFPEKIASSDKLYKIVQQAHG